MAKNYSRSGRAKILHLVDCCRIDTKTAEELLEMIEHTEESKLRGKEWRT